MQGQEGDSAMCRGLRSAPGFALFALSSGLVLAIWWLLASSHIHVADRRKRGGGTAAHYACLLSQNFPESHLADVASF
jgi:hypothetical protein